MTPVFWLRAVGRLLVVFAALVVVVFGYVAGRVWWVAREDSRPRSDAIVVLGASQFNGRPSAVFRARLDHAKVLYDDHVAPRVVTVGGKQPGDRYTEAGSGAAYLTEVGVPARAVVAVPQGKDTLASLRAVDTVFRERHWRSVVLVTDPWHTLRSRTMARDLGLTVATSPVHTGPAVRDRNTEVRYVLRETFAYLYYRVFHSDNVHGSGAV